MEALVAPVASPPAQSSTSPLKITPPAQPLDEWKAYLPAPAAAPAIVAAARAAASPPVRAAASPPPAAATVLPRAAIGSTVRHRIATRGESHSQAVAVAEPLAPAESPPERALVVVAAKAFQPISEVPIPGAPYLSEVRRLEKKAKSSPSSPGSSAASPPLALPAPAPASAAAPAPASAPSPPAALPLLPMPAAGSTLRPQIGAVPLTPVCIGPGTWSAPSNGPAKPRPRPRTPPEAEIKQFDRAANLSVPSGEKEQAQALGAKWDSLGKTWYVPRGRYLEPFERWSPRAVAPPSPPPAPARRRRPHRHRRQRLQPQRRHQRDLAQRHRRRHQRLSLSRRGRHRRVASATLFFACRSCLSMGGARRGRCASRHPTTHRKYTSASTRG